MKMQKTFFVILLVVLLSTFIMAQNSAKITGKVLTADGTAIPGVMVTATNPKMIGKTIAITDENGVYRLMNLAAGTYKLVYELEGFATMVNPKIALGLEQTLRIPITMELKKLKEVIIVKGQIPLIDVKSAAQGMNLSKETFNSLPKGRDFTSLVTAIPGVIDEPTLSGISIDGASGAENVFYIDGVDVTNPVYGEQGQEASFDFIEEVQVKSSGYMAEFGGSLGGVISAVTKSGGNTFHGDITTYYSGTALNGSRRDRLQLDADDETKATWYTDEQWYGPVKESRLEAGLSLGGYILKDKVWFFGAFMPRLTNYKNHVVYNDGAGTKDHVTNTTSLNYMIKLSAQLLTNVRWSASYVNDFYKRRGTDAVDNRDYGPYGNYNTDFDAAGYDWPSFSASSSLDITIGNNSILNIRGGWYQQNKDNNQLPPFTEARYYFYGENTMYPEIPADMQHGNRWRNRGYYDGQMLVMEFAEKQSIGGDFTHYFNAAGEHSLKIGGQFVRQGEDVNNMYGQPNTYLHWGETEFTKGGVTYPAGKYGWLEVRGDFNSGPMGDVYKAYSNRYNFYIQDSWTIGEKLTLNIGVRTESEYIPSYSPDPAYKDAKPIKFGFGDKIAPRFGFVYDVKGDSSFKIFGSYGLFYDVMKLQMAGGALGGELWTSSYYSLDEWDYSLIKIDSNPNTFRTTKNWRPTSFESIDPDMKPMSQQSISLGFENKLNDDLSLSVRFVQKHLRYAIEDIGVLVDGEEEYYYANPGYGYSKLIANGGRFEDGYPETPKAKREYWGVNIGLEKRFSNNWMGGISYTWSRLTGNYSGLASSDEIYSDGTGRNDPNTSRGYDSWFLAYDKQMNPIDGNLATDRPHVFKAYGSYIFPFGLTVGTVVNVMSGTPITEEWTVFDMEMFPNGRGNLGRTSMFYNADLYAEYNMNLGKANLQFSVNITNVFNFKIARRMDPLRNMDGENIPVSYAQLLDNSWEYPVDMEPNPRFGMEYLYTEPISARLGLKLSF